MNKLLYQGAEAKIFLDEKDNLIIKDRIKKSYRINELDEKIRKQRTKSEKKLLEKACKIINAPNPLPLKEFNIIKMPFIEGKKLSDSLDFFPLEKQKEIMKTIGEETAKIHDVDIIHGDLTTSNMILVEKESDNEKNNVDNDKRLVSYKQHKRVPPLTISYGRVSDFTNLPIIQSEWGCELGREANYEPVIYFIDFGLGFISKKIEDKAVDIHLLKQALEAKHFKNWQVLFEEFLKGYKKSKEENKILERLKAIELRGRYRH